MARVRAWRMEVSSQRSSCSFKVETSEASPKRPSAVAAACRVSRAFEGFVRVFKSAGMARVSPISPRACAAEARQHGVMSLCMKSTSASIGLG